MAIWNRIFGGSASRKPYNQSQQYVNHTSEDGQTRMVTARDTSASAVAARHNFASIYGAANMPRNFTAKQVIEVKDKNGKWTPVTGNRKAIPDLETQLGALASFRETGIIGPQPVADGGGGGTTGQPDDPSQNTTGSSDVNGTAAGVIDRPSEPNSLPPKAVEEAVAAEIPLFLPQQQQQGTSLADAANTAALLTGIGNEGPRGEGVSMMPLSLANDLNILNANAQQSAAQQPVVIATASPENPGPRKQPQRPAGQQQQGAQFGGQPLPIIMVPTKPGGQGGNF